VSERLAINGGRPVRGELLPYGHQTIEQQDVDAVAEILRSDWLTTGPSVGAFEQEFARVTTSANAVAVSSGTAALHAAVFAAGVGPGDEVIVPAMTFASSANVVVFQGGTPVFADVDPNTLLIDPVDVERRVTERTKAIIAVDYTGQPCAYDELRAIASARRLLLIADACHSLGAAYRDRLVGTLADLSAFSFHPVKHITTGEGGMVTTDDRERARRMRGFRNHGITLDHHQRDALGSWYYEMVDLGYNYRLTDIGCALGIAQLNRLGAWLERRRAIAAKYDRAFAGMPAGKPLAVRSSVRHAYHLYVVRFDRSRLKADRAGIFAALRAEGIGVNVHYIPVHLHPYYRSRFKTARDLCPVAEAAYEEIVSLPMFPAMSDDDVRDVIEAVTKVVGAYAA
jgi:perosamine synthetase